MIAVGWKTTTPIVRRRRVGISLSGSIQLAEDEQDDEQVRLSFLGCVLVPLGVWEQAYILLFFCLGNGLNSFTLWVD